MAGAQALAGERGRAVRLTVRVVPRAPRDEVVGFQPDGALRVRLCAPPVEGRANEALVRLLFSGTPITLGDATLAAKHASTNTDVRRTWILFGDPTTRLKR